MKNYKDIGIYNFSDYAEEITGDALFKINGGATSCSSGATSASPAQTTTTPSGPTGPSGNPSDTENKTTTGSWGRVDETYRNTNMQQYKETEVDKKMNGSNLFSLVSCKISYLGI
ncbi:MAG: hypothetical protein MJ160_02125 [Treponema sp.]|nr:hypothetical protein [Treponema sp.]